MVIKSVPMIWKELCVILSETGKTRILKYFPRPWNFYLKKENKVIGKLRKYADIFGISRQIEEILEVIMYE